MLPTTAVKKLNQELAERIDKEVRATSQHPYVGKFVAIANGQVVGVKDNLDDAGDLLEEIEPDNQRTLMLEAGVDYDEIEYFWSPF